MSFDGYLTGSDNERRLVQSIGCPRCGASAGRWCRNTRNRIEPAKHPHAARMSALEATAVDSNGVQR